MRTFVMGDIHGSFKALQQCLQQCNFNYDDDRLIQLGDIADSHDDVFLCVEELLKIKNLVSVKGNHDEWFNEFIATGTHPEKWIQGGRGTALSYLRLTGRGAEVIKRSGGGFKIPLGVNDIPVTHQRFFQQQQLYYIENNNCFLHAGFDRQLAFQDQEQYTYYWNRELWTEALSYETLKKGNPAAGAFQMVTAFNNVFIGHTPTTHWKTDKPMHAANIYNIDTGAGHSGRLTIMQLDSKKYWQSELVTMFYSSNYR